MDKYSAWTEKSWITFLLKSDGDCGLILSCLDLLAGLAAWLLLGIYSKEGGKRNS